MSWEPGIESALAFSPTWERDRPWRVGLVGVGNIARRAHLPAYRKLGLNLVAAADVNEPALAAAQRDGNIGTVYTDYREMFAHEKLDVVDITVHERWSDVKLDAVRAAAEAGVHVLIQKPLALDYETCAAMVDAAKRAGVVMAVNQNARWAPAFRAAKILLDAGCAGAIRAINITARRPPRSGDVLLNFSVHSLDLVRYYLGREPSRVFACVTEAKNPDQSFINVTLDFGAGVQGCIWDDCAGHLNVDSPWDFYIAGNEGSIRGSDYFGGVLGQAWVEGWNQKTPEIVVRPRLRYAWQPDAFANVMSDFLDAIVEGRSPIASGEDNLKSVRLLYAARESATTGLPVPMG